MGNFAENLNLGNRFRPPLRVRLIHSNTLYASGIEMSQHFQGPFEFRV